MSGKDKDMTFADCVLPRSTWLDQFLGTHNSWQLDKDAKLFKYAIIASHIFKIKTSLYEYLKSEHDSGTDLPDVISQDSKLIGYLSEDSIDSRDSFDKRLKELFPSKDTSTGHNNDGDGWVATFSDGLSGFSASITNMASGLIGSESGSENEADVADQGSQTPVDVSKLIICLLTCSEDKWQFLQKNLVMTQAFKNHINAFTDSVWSQVIVNDDRLQFLKEMKLENGPIDSYMKALSDVSVSNLKHAFYTDEDATSLQHRNLALWISQAIKNKDINQLHLILRLQLRRDDIHHLTGSSQNELEKLNLYDHPKRHDHEAHAILDFLLKFPDEKKTDQFHQVLMCLYFSIKGGSQDFTVDEKYTDAFCNSMDKLCKDTGGYEHPFDKLINHWHAGYHCFAKDQVDHFKTRLPLRIEDCFNEHQFNRIKTEAFSTFLREQHQKTDHLPIVVNYLQANASKHKAIISQILTSALFVDSTIDEMPSDDINRTNRTLLTSLIKENRLQTFLDGIQETTLKKELLAELCIQKAAGLVLDKLTCNHDTHIQNFMNVLNGDFDEGRKEFIESNAKYYKNICIKVLNNSINVKYLDYGIIETNVEKKDLINMIKHGFPVEKACILKINGTGNVSFYNDADISLTDAQKAQLTVYFGAVEEIPNNENYSLYYKPLSSSSADQWMSDLRMLQKNQGVAIINMQELFDDFKSAFKQFDATKTNHVKELIKGFYSDKIVELMDAVVNFKTADGQQIQNATEKFNLLKETLDKKFHSPAKKQRTKNNKPTKAADQPDYLYVDSHLFRAIIRFGLSNGVDMNQINFKPSERPVSLDGLYSHEATSFPNPQSVKKLLPLVEKSYIEPIDEFFIKSIVVSDSGGFGKVLNSSSCKENEDLWKHVLKFALENGSNDSHKRCIQILNFMTKQIISDGNELIDLLRSILAEGEKSADFISNAIAMMATIIVSNNKKLSSHNRDLKGLLMGLLGSIDTNNNKHYVLIEDLVSNKKLGLEWNKVDILPKMIGRHCKKVNVFDGVINLDEHLLAIISSAWGHNDYMLSYVKDKVLTLIDDKKIDYLKSFFQDTADLIKGHEHDLFIDLWCAVKKLIDQEEYNETWLFEIIKPNISYLLAYKNYELLNSFIDQKQDLTPGHQKENCFGQIAKHCIGDLAARDQVNIRDDKRICYANQVIWQVVQQKEVNQDIKDYVLKLIENVSADGIDSRAKLFIIFNKHDWLLLELMKKGMSLTNQLGDGPSPMWHLLKEERFELLDQIKQPIPLNYAYEVFWQSLSAALYVAFRYCQDVVKHIFEGVKKWGFSFDVAQNPTTTAQLLGNDVSPADPAEKLSNNQAGPDGPKNNR